MQITGVRSLHKHSPASFILFIHTLHWKENSAILFFLEEPGSLCGAWSVKQGLCDTGLGLHSSDVAAFGVPGVCQLKDPSEDSRNNYDFMQMQNRQQIQPAFKICPMQISPARVLSTSTSRLLSLSTATLLPLTNI